ncbi:DUF2071 domain-containing protein [Halobacteria archaeon HArc-gm2]|nr:DUF2071 domain-containing protein [Halobacteria archaeon HArc-gm2]
MSLARADVRDVCFAHWPVEAGELAARLPAALAPATRDGSAWVSVLGQRTGAGIRGVPWRYEYAQLAVRAYVVPAEPEERFPQVGVHFLDVESGSRFASLGARLLYDIPFRHTSVRHRRSGNTFEIDGDAFRARFEPHGETAVADPDTLAGWLTDRYRYYLPDGSHGVTEHPPWKLAKTAVSIEENRVLDRLDLPEPVGDAVFRYSPGAEFRLKRRP